MCMYVSAKTHTYTSLADIPFCKNAFGVDDLTRIGIVVDVISSPLSVMSPPHCSQSPHVQLSQSQLGI